MINTESMEEQLQKNDSSLFVVKPGGTYFLLGVASLLFWFYLCSKVISFPIHIIGNRSLWIPLAILLYSVRCFLMSAFNKTEVSEKGIRIKKFWKKIRFYSWEEIEEVHAYYDKKAFERPKYPEEKTMYSNNKSILHLSVTFCEGAERLVDVLRDKGYIE